LQLSQNKRRNNFINKNDFSRGFMKPIVRFAPSPTGMLHIGNVRTALFNYIFAKQHGGKFLLRIEDTDQERSTEEAVEVIFDGLKWLGLDYDGEAIFQSSRIEHHKQLAYLLLEQGKAYRCYADADEMEILRHDARTDNEKIIYPDREAPRFSDEDDKPFTIRLKTPLTGRLILQDAIRGDVKINASEIDDMILLRSDGTATYMHAVVCDDIEMNITHIIRGEDHLINAFRQAYLYEALGKKLPVFAHLPLIHGSDGAKLSKRHGATSVREWRELGFLPEMLINYLITLGWNELRKDKFTLDEVINKLDLSAISKSASQLDNGKISFLSGLYIRSLPDDELVARYQEYAGYNGQKLADYALEILQQAAPLFKERSSTLKEFGFITNFLVTDSHIIPDTKSKILLDKPENIQILINIVPEFEAITDWSQENIAAMFKQFLKTHSLKMPNIGLLLRACVAGVTNTPDLASVLAILGKEKTMARIKVYLK
jgi:glutamyl-tRNA synthetase